MSIVVACNDCGKRFGVADKHADKLIMCPGCRGAIRVGPASESSTETRSSQKSAVKKRKGSAQKGRQRPSRRAAPAFEDEEFELYDTYHSPPPQLRPSKRSAKTRAKENKRMLQLAAGALIVVVVPVTAVYVGMRLYNVATDPPQSVAQPTEPRPDPEPFTEVPPGTSVIAGSQPPASPAPVHVENTIEGDRVAWLDAAGNGYARLGGGWMYSGSSENVPFHAGSGDLQFPLIETMRTNSLVELFDPSSNTRVRLTSHKAVAYPKDASSEFTQSGGSWKTSTGEAGWLAGISETGVPGFNQVGLSDSDRLEDLIVAVEPNVVRVDVTAANGSSGNGSGFLVDPSGRVVTNYHVVEGSKSATVVFKGDGDRKAIRLDVVGFLHLDSKRDIAVLQVELPSDFRRPGLQIAEQEPAKGSSVVAFGAPLGLDFTASEGIISGSRSATELENTIGLSDRAGNWIQTTAPISPGNSGGPLVDRKGHVVAINSMTLRIGQQLNFALSSDDIRQAVEKSAMYAEALTPENAPVKIAPHGGPLEELPDGRRFYAIEGTVQSESYLKDLQEFQFLVLTSDLSRPYDGRIVGELRNYLSKAIRPLDVRVVADEGPVLLVLVSAQGDHLDLAAHLIVANRESGKRPVRIWRKAGDMGRVTRRMQREKRFTGSVQQNMREFFGELHDAIQKARSEEHAESGNETEGSESEADRE